MKNNRILNLKNDQGQLQDTHQQIEEELHQYFIGILIESNQHSEEHIRKITNHIATILTKEHNQMLLKNITMEELEESVQSIPNGKAPRHDGFPINFYKAY